MHEFQPLTIDEAQGVLASLREVGHGRVPQGEHADPVWPGSQQVPVFVREGQNLTCKLLTWGYELPPSKKPVYNTRIEKLLEQESRGEGFWAASRRCLIPARMYWVPSSQGDVAFRPIGMPVFLMAGVFEADRFSIVTVPADETVAPVHPRMPFLLPRGTSQGWLNGLGAPTTPPQERVG